MGELGLLGIMVPEKLGGGGADTLSYVLALEEVAVACASHAVVMSVSNSLVCGPLAQQRDTGAARALPRASGLRPRAWAASP